jgi:hypothetical protein
MADPFMAEPIPRTMPRSTLACPPAKNFTDQYLKSTQPSQQQLSIKPSATNISIKPAVEPEAKPIKEPVREQPVLNNPRPPSR